jgi:protein involved in polysaccharide export with SLBB domain
MFALCLGAGALVVNAQSAMSSSKGDGGSDRAMASYFGARSEKPEGPALAIEDSLFFLSPGDQLKLRWWGIGTGSEDLIVNTRWELVIPDRGVIKAKGIPFSKVRDSIEALLRSQIKIKMIDLQIVDIVPAQVQVTGLVPNPGSFEVTAGSRLSAVIQLAGLNLKEVLRSQASSAPPRPGDRYRLPSVRRILLVRGGGDSVWCDLAKAWNAGSITDDPRLFSGDRIRIFEQGPLVAVSGNVPYSGYFEMLPGESLGSFLTITGIQDSLKVGCQVMTVNGVRRVAGLDSKLDTSVALVELPALQHRPVPPVVWVTGFVRNAGGLSFKEGMTVRDAVLMAGGSSSEGDSALAVGVKRGWAWLQAGRRPGLDASQQYIEVRQALASYLQQMRGNYSDPNARLQPGDSVVVYQTERVVWVGGLVNRPGYVTWDSKATYQDYVDAAGGYAPRAWSDRVRLFDLYTEQFVPLGQPIRPGSALVVPEKRYLYFDQWVTLGATVVSAVVSVMYFYLAMGNQ